MVDVVGTYCTLEGRMLSQWWGVNMEGGERTLKVEEIPMFRHFSRPAFLVGGYLIVYIDEESVGGPPS